MEAVTETVREALRDGIGVIYVHHDGARPDFSDSLLDIFGVNYVGDNYWRKLQLLGFDGTVDHDVMPADEAALLHVLRSLPTSDGLGLDLSGCSNNGCGDDSSFDTEFLAPVSAVRSRMLARDAAGTDLFAEADYTLDKGLVLLADLYRQAVNFPMDKTSTPQGEFLRALYADMVHPIKRQINAVPRDLGNFSRTDFSHVTREAKSVELTSAKTYRSAGVYAVPGQTVRVRRTDTSDVTTHIKVNMIRAGATHIFDRNAYRSRDGSFFRPGRDRAVGIRKYWTTCRVARTRR